MISFIRPTRRPQPSDAAALLSAFAVLLYSDTVIRFYASVALHRYYSSMAGSVGCSLTASPAPAPSTIWWWSWRRYRLTEWLDRRENCEEESGEEGTLLGNYRRYFRSHRCHHCSNRMLSRRRTMKFESLCRECLEPAARATTLRKAHIRISMDSHRKHTQTHTYDT